MRDSPVPDALLRRPMEHGAVYKDHLHEARHEDHLHVHGPLHIQRRHGQGEGRLRSADARADKVNGQYVIKTKARKLDTECFSSEPEYPTWRQGPSSGDSDRTRECAVNA